MTTWLIVGAGGALGALFRALCTDNLAKILPKDFPWPTLIVNSIACFLMGVLIPLTLSSFVTNMVVIGFLGAFSTMSTLSYEVIDLAFKREFSRSAAYLYVSYGCCLLATVFGYALISGLMV